MIFGYESFTETADMSGRDFYRVDGGERRQAALAEEDGDKGAGDTFVLI